MRIWIHDVVLDAFRPGVRLAEPKLGDDLAAWDGWLAQTLNAPLLAQKPFTPLPVLGVPGWSPANNDPAYYADAQVFRPRRTDNPTAP